MLLFAVTAQREMAWSAFTSAIDSIFVPDARIAADLAHVRSAVAALGDTLGHWEVVRDGGTARIVIAPPVLAVLPHPGRPTAVLCGSRSPDTRPALTEACRAIGADLRVTRQDPLSPYAPSVLEVAADSYDALADAADRLHVSIRPEPAAWSIAAAMGSVGGYLASLEWSAGADLNWPRRDFDCEHLRLAPVPLDTARVGLTLSAYRHPDGWMRVDRLWRDSEFAATDRDWARYAALADRHLRVVTYNVREGTVAAPRQVPLPRLAARSFALCSGRAPQTKPGAGLGAWVYRCVPTSIFRTIASKLGQDGAGDGEVQAA
jgi:hypothetical protein